MKHARTIAMAHLLLADGRAADVARMIKPLLGSDAATAEQVHLRGLLTRVRLFGETDAAAAQALLAPLAERPARAALPPEARAEAALWLGWTRLVDQEPNRALPLLHEAAQGFGVSGSPRGRLWTRLGLAEAYAALGEALLASAPFAEAEALQHAWRDAQVEARLEALRDTLPERKQAPLASGIASVSAAGRALAEALEAARASRRPALLLGERGAGKLHAARRLHAARPDGAPWVVLDAGAIEHAPLERRFSEGGAALLSEAAGGTLCVREVGALPRAAQEALLNLLGTNERRPNAEAVRLVATTRGGLDEQVRQGAFLEPLYDALAGLPIRVPPLRARRADVAPLARHFLDTLRPADAPRVALTAPARQALVGYDWPGNIRQLRNEVERALLLVGTEPAPTADLRHLSSAVTAPPPRAPSVALPDPAQILRPGRCLDDLLADAEKALIERVLAAREGHVTASAEVLGLTRQGLYKKMKRLGINAASFQSPAVPAS